jgi:hypothetical protein
MKTPATLMGILLLLIPLLATAQPPGLATTADQIRSGEIDVGDDYSMNTETGRFHIIHADKVLMDCTNCHIGEQYSQDYLSISRDKPYPLEAKGQYERSVCLGCHQEGGAATTFYQGSATR